MIFARTVRHASAAVDLRLQHTHAMGHKLTTSKRSVTLAAAAAARRLVRQARQAAQVMQATQTSRGVVQWRPPRDRRTSASHCSAQIEGVEWAVRCVSAETRWLQRGERGGDVP